MKIDVINGYEYLIFEENERDQARAAIAAGRDYYHVRIATTCCVCGDPIEASVDSLAPCPSDNYHESMPAE
jgi:hypothetical protein